MHYAAHFQLILIKRIISSHIGFMKKGILLFVMRNAGTPAENPHNREKMTDRKTFYFSAEILHGRFFILGVPNSFPSFTADVSMLKLDSLQPNWSEALPSGNHQPRSALMTLGSTMSVTFAVWIILPYSVSMTALSPSLMPKRCAVSG